MPKTTFTDAESTEFIRLLRKIQGDGYWLPDTAIFQEVQKTFSRWCLELVIIRSEAGIPRVLLCRYDGDGVPEHKGLFHIPGGFEKFLEGETETVIRIAKDELGIGMSYLGLLGHHKWTVAEHPSGARIMSLYAACEPLGDIELSESCRFFSKDEMLELGPRDMAPDHPHRQFLLQYLSDLEDGVQAVPVAYGL